MKTSLLVLVAVAAVTVRAEWAADEAKVDLPTETELVVASGNAFAQVLVDGVDLGTRAWAPFVWRVPSELAGKDRRLTIRVTTSLLPIFGNPQAPGAKWKRDFYKPPRSGESEPGLISVDLNEKGES